MPKTVISDKTAAEILEYYAANFKISEISSITGIKQSTVRMFLNRKGATNWDKPQDKSTDTPAAPQEKPVDTSTQKVDEPSGATPVPPTVKEKTLKDFQSRDMIKYLYSLGYRIKNNSLVCLVEQPVNVKDIINS